MEGSKILRQLTCRKRGHSWRARFGCWCWAWLHRSCTCPEAPPSEPGLILIWRRQRRALGVGVSSDLRLWMSSLVAVLSANEDFQNCQL